MFGLICGIVFIILGIKSLYLAFILKQSKDITIIKNNMVNIEKIKDKEGYLKFNIKINMMLGIIICSNGIMAILSEYFITLDNIATIINLAMFLSIFVYIYNFSYKAPKFQE